jgi:hypothetical protein
MFKEDTEKICLKTRKSFQENTCLLDIKVAGARSRNYWWPNLEISVISYLFGMRLKYIPRKVGKRARKGIVWETIHVTAGGKDIYSVLRGRAIRCKEAK